jgi:hypothetical protein
VVDMDISSGGGVKQTAQAVERVPLFVWLVGRLGVVALNPLDLLAAAEDERDPLVKRGGLGVEDPLSAG